MHQMMRPELQRTGVLSSGRHTAGLFQLLVGLSVMSDQETGHPLPGRTIEPRSRITWWANPELLHALVEACILIRNSGRIVVKKWKSCNCH
jgi:hypothetical protein